MTDDPSDLFMPEEQLLLPLQARRDMTLAELPEILFAEARFAFEQLRRGELRQLHLSGEPGSGRSLLLAAFAHAGLLDTAGEALLLPLHEVVFMSPEMLEGMERYSLILLDDLDALRGWPDWQEALFHLYNRLQASGSRLVTTAASSPMLLDLALPDLVSRLSRASVHALPPPDDASRLILLDAVASRRGWHLEPELQRYLVERAPRRLGHFLRLLERLDARSLQSRRPLTVPLARELLIDAVPTGSH